MAPLRLRDVCPAIGSGNGGGRITVYNGSQAPAIRYSANDVVSGDPFEQRLRRQEKRRQLLSGVCISAGMGFVAQLQLSSRAMWRYPSQLPCRPVALGTTETAIMVRPTTVSLAVCSSSSSSNNRRSSSSSRGRTLQRQRQRQAQRQSQRQRQRYTVSRGRCRRPFSRSTSPVRSGRIAGARRSPPLCAKSTATPVARGYTSKVCACALDSAVLSWGFGLLNVLFWL